MRYGEGKTATLTTALRVVWLGHAGHIGCCEQLRFLCGAAYHPEALATESDDEDDCCQPCVDAMYDSMHGEPCQWYECPFTKEPCP